MMLKFSAWGMVIVWIILIFTMSFKEGQDSAQLSQGITQQIVHILGLIRLNVDENTLHILIRKTAHFTIYLLLAVWVLSALLLHHLSFKETLILGFFVVLAVASIDETIQLFIDGRSGSLVDVMIDMFGATLGGFLRVYYHVTFNSKGFIKRGTVL